MKKIINNKVYDTATAQQVGQWDNGIYGGDLDACAETLYRKRTGEFFLHGEGGARSRYAVSRGNNNWGSGEQLIPLSYDAAKQWAEEHLTSDQYEAIFGSVVEDDSRVNATFSLAKSTLERARRKSAADGVSLSMYIESLITADA